MWFCWLQRGGGGWKEGRRQAPEGPGLGSSCGGGWALGSEPPAGSSTLSLHENEATREGRARPDQRTGRRGTSGVLTGDRPCPSCQAFPGGCCEPPKKSLGTCCQASSLPPQPCSPSPAGPTGTSSGLPPPGSLPETILSSVEQLTAGGQSPRKGTGAWSRGIPPSPHQLPRLWDWTS